jgi:hypothetical protein
LRRRVRLAGAALFLGGAFFVWGCATSGVAVKEGDGGGSGALLRPGDAAEGPTSPGYGGLRRPSGEAGPVKEAFVIPGVPFIPQEEETCGPTSLAMLLRFLGREAPVGDLVRETRTEGLRGVLITDLAAAARKRGLPAEVAVLDLAGLEKRIRGGTPVILLVDLGTWVLVRPHYMLAYGYGPKGVVAHSGYTAGQVVPGAKLERQWAKMNHLAVVVEPPVRP